jgi:hypothetical protein
MLAVDEGAKALLASLASHTNPASQSVEDRQEGTQIRLQEPVFGLAAIVIKLHTSVTDTQTASIYLESTTSNCFKQPRAPDFEAAALHLLVDSSPGS